MTTTTVSTPTSVFENIIAKYLPENSDDLSAELLEECPFCLVERSVDGDAYWLSLHESIQDAVEYCADAENVDMWAAYELVNVYSGQVYRPKRSVSFLHSS